MVASNKETISTVPTITTKVLNNNHSHQQNSNIESQNQGGQDDAEGNNKSSTDRKSKSKKKEKFTCRQKLALTSLALVDFMSFCSMSIMAPFFPREASKKGMSDTVSGFVFSFYALVMFLSSPVFGKILPKFGEKFLFISGIALSGTCSILFGLLEYVNNYSLFTFLSFFIRGLEALGASAYSTASYVFVINIFPNHMGTVRGTLETFVGLGMSAGPAIGGFLFSLGGFGLPFYVVGIISLVITPLNFMLLPPSTNGHQDKKSGSILQLIKVPGVVVTGFVIINVSITWSFLDPTLEPHLRQYNLSPENIGLLFLLLSASYGLSSPGWGWLADRFDQPWSMMVAGLLFSSFGLLLLGPSPGLPFLDGSIWTVIASLSILGLAEALALLPTFDGVLIFALKGGLEDNLATQSVVAGMWSCAYSLGEVIGPSAGGVLLQYYGFPVAATAVAAADLILVIVCVVYFTMSNSNSRANTNTNRALENRKSIHFENGVEGSWRTTSVVETEGEVKNSERY